MMAPARAAGSMPTNGEEDGWGQFVDIEESSIDDADEAEYDADDVLGHDGHHHHALANPGPVYFDEEYGGQQHHQQAYASQTPSPRWQPQPQHSPYQTFYDGSPAQACHYRSPPSPCPSAVSPSPSPVPSRPGAPHPYPHQYPRQQQQQQQQRRRRQVYQHQPVVVMAPVPHQNSQTMYRQDPHQEQTQQRPMIGTERVLYVVEKNSSTQNEGGKPVPSHSSRGRAYDEPKRPVRTVQAVPRSTPAPFFGRSKRRTPPAAVVVPRRQNTQDSEPGSVEESKTNSFSSGGSQTAAPATPSIPTAASSVAPQQISLSASASALPYHKRPQHRFDAPCVYPYGYTPDAFAARRARARPEKQKQELPHHDDHTERQPHEDNDVAIDYDGSNDAQGFAPSASAAALASETNARYASHRNADPQNHSTSSPAALASKQARPSPAEMVELLVHLHPRAGSDPAAAFRLRQQFLRASPEKQEAAVNAAILTARKLGKHQLLAQHGAARVLM